MVPGTPFVPQEIPRVVLPAISPAPTVAQQEIFKKQEHVNYFYFFL